MNTLKLTDDNDLAIENNNLVVVTGINALRDRLATNLKTFQGEWFLDTTLGIPYFTEVFKKKINVGALYTIFSSVLSRTSGVKAVNKLVFDLNSATRVLAIQFSVTADDGTILEENISLGVI